jgi:tetratricopeptide (TPR) repeat protein
MKAMGSTIPMGNIPTPITNADPTPYNTYLDSAITLLKTNDTGAAFIRYIKAIRANPALAEKSLAENSNNLVQSQQYPLAILQYNMLLKLNASNPFYYFLRGCAYFGANNMNAAITDWEIAGNMNNHDVQQSAAYNLSVAYDSVRKPIQAYQYVLKAQKLGYKTAPDFVEKLKSKAASAK